MAEDVSAPGGFVRRSARRWPKFERGLRLAIACLPVGAVAWVPAGGPPGGVTLDIDHWKLPNVAWARFRLPVPAARYRFVAGDAPDCAALLARIDHAMQRGG